MKGRLRKLVLFLLLGAIINVAVAWACALELALLTANGPFGRSGATGDRAPCWVVEELDRLGATRYLWTHVSFDFDNAPGTVLYIFDETEPVDLDGLPRWSRLDYSKPPPQKYRGWGLFFIDDARGWPLLAMSSFSALGVDPDKDALLVKSSDGFSLPASLRRKPPFVDVDDELFNRPIVPLRPIWPGFAINTAFYAVLLWCMFFSFGAYRRHRRRARGRCPQCAYPIGSSDVCTECGTKLIADARKSAIRERAVDHDA